MDQLQKIEIKGIVIKDHYQVVSQLMRPLHGHEHKLFNKTAP